MTATEAICEAILATLANDSDRLEKVERAEALSAIEHLKENFTLQSVFESMDDEILNDRGLRFVKWTNETPPQHSRPSPTPI